MAKHEPSSFEGYPSSFLAETGKYTLRSAAKGARGLLVVLALLVGGVLLYRLMTRPAPVVLDASLFPEQTFSSAVDACRTKGWELRLGTLVEISEPFVPEDADRDFFVRRYTLFPGTWEEWLQSDGQSISLETFLLPFDAEVDAEVGKTYAVQTVPLSWGDPPFIGLSGPHWHEERALINPGQGLLEMNVKPYHLRLGEASSVADTEAARSLGVAGMPWEELNCIR